MNDLQRWLRFVVFTLIGALLAGAVLGGCGSDDDDATAAPKAFVSAVDGKTYCAWIENPHECPGPPGPPAAPFAMPDEEPRQEGMSTTDFLILMALFNYRAGYSDYYHSDRYYRERVTPAWERHPGSYSAGPGRSTTRTFNADSYRSTTTKFATKYAPRVVAEREKAVYKTAKGKEYKGTTAPVQVFSGGSAGTSPDTRSKTNTKTGPDSKTGTTGRPSFSGGNSSRPSGGSTGGSSRSGK